MLIRQIAQKMRCHEYTQIRMKFWDRKRYHSAKRMGNSIMNSHVCIIREGARPRVHLICSSAIHGKVSVTISVQIILLPNVFYIGVHHAADSLVCSCFLIMATVVQVMMAKRHFERHKVRIVTLNSFSGVLHVEVRSFSTTADTMVLFSGSSYVVTAVVSVVDWTAVAAVTLVIFTVFALVGAAAFVVNDGTDTTSVDFATVLFLVVVISAQNVFAPLEISAFQINMVLIHVF